MILLIVVLIHQRLSFQILLMSIGCYEGTHGLKGAEQRIHPVVLIGLIIRILLVKLLEVMM